MFHTMHRGHGRDCGSRGGFSRGPFSVHWEFGGDPRGGGRGRGRRMFDGGELRLVLLKLIADEPRHGYELIRAVEELTGGEYAPSPGVVYPTLTFLEEAGYVTSQPDGAKKLFTATAEGNAYLAENRALAEAGLQRLTLIGEKARRIRERMRGDESDEDRPRVPHMVRAALHNLRDAAAERLGNDPDAEAKITEILVRAASELRKRDN